MNAKKINTLFKHPEEITSEDLIGLKQAVDDFPYAAPLHALYMKALQKKESYLLPGQIKRAAIATPNRAALKEFHDMPIPGMESAKEVPVVDFTEVAEAGKVEEVEVADKAPEKKAVEPVKAEEPVKAKVEKAAEPATPKTEKKHEVKAEAAAQKSEPVKPEPVVKEPVKLDTPKPKAAPAKPASEQQDLSHLPEAVRKAILRSRTLRGEETTASGTEEKKPAEVEAPKVEQRPTEVPAEPAKKVEEPTAAEVVVPVQAAPVKKEVQPARVEEKPAEEKAVQIKKSAPAKEKSAPVEETPIQEQSKPAQEKPALEKPKKAPKAPKPKQSKPTKVEAAPVEEKLEVREMPFSEKASFMEWLTADFSDGEPKKVERSAPKDVKTIISELPKFPVPKKDGKIDVFHLPSDDQGKFVTETLAEIYLKQALWDKAINAYEVLSLKYPEKSGFFADRIREIKKQKK
jgi:hypothetical protein